MGMKKPWLLLATVFFLLAVGFTIVKSQSNVELSEQGHLMSDREFIEVSIERSTYMILAALSITTAFVFFIYGLYE